MENFLVDESFETTDNFKTPRLSALCLFIKREQGNVLLPEKERFMRIDDRFLMCGTRETFDRLNVILKDEKALVDFING